MGTRELLYLQSLDSVRAVPGPPEGELQVLLEVTLALALGRVVVIPQADAFGSLAFLRVVRELPAARDAAGGGEAPFRLYRPEVRTSISGCVTPAGSTTSERSF